MAASSSAGHLIKSWSSTQNPILLSSCESEFYGEVKAAGVTLGYQARVEEDLSRINAQEATAALSFWRISGSVSYADITAAPDYGRPEDMRQVWANAYYDIDGTWSVFGNLRYDWDDEKFMTQSLGIAFDCDCMRAALTYSMSNSGAFGVAEEGTEQRIDLSIALRTIGAVTGSFKVP